ncbi:MAG TPA: pilus assembly protein PilX [Ruminococcus sp.]|nr:pilus assembly protein PilX [Ruminococcus sp.]
MRKWNAILSMGILVLFLIHAIAGGFQLVGILSGGSQVLKILAWFMMILIVIHAIIGCKLTADTLKACKQSGTSYFKENRLFWLRRISGFSIMLFIVCHLLIFTNTTTDGIVRLHLFEGAQLATQILLVISIAVHVLSNIKPLLIALGTRGGREFLIDILLVLSVLLVGMAIAFIVYYLRWNVM